MAGSGSISRMFPSDYVALDALVRCGHLSHENLLEIGVSDNRINTYIGLGLFSVVDTHSDTFYRLSDTGTVYALGYSHSEVAYHSNSPVHDGYLYDKYSGLSDTEKPTWMTEREQREYCEINGIDLRGCSVSDGMYISDEGELVCVEIDTGYPGAVVAMKYEYINRVGGVADYVKV